MSDTNDGGGKYLWDGWPDDVFADALEAWGVDAQVILAIEENAELNTELARDWRGRNDAEDIVDEIADVLIAANQLARIYGREQVEGRIEYKLQRLRRRIDRDQGAGGSG